MDATLSLPPRIVLRDLMLTTVTHKLRIFLIFLVIMASSVGIAVNTDASYKTTSTLLVLMGPEFGVRPNAGTTMSANGGLLSEEILRTEASILASDDLHRSVIQEIGIGKLYPKLLLKPTAFQQWMTGFKQTLTDLLGLSEPTTGDASGRTDPMPKAVEAFTRNLVVTVDKKSSVIMLDFFNPDRMLSAEALRILEANYLALRAKLYGDVQAPIVLAQQETVGRQLAAADTALQAFKQEHDISNFSERRQIMLRQQGELEIAKSKAEAMIAAETARFDQLNQQLATVTGQRSPGRNAASGALEGMVRAYEQQQNIAQSQYRGSPAMDDARRNMLATKTDIARMEATQAYGVQGERNKTEAELRGSLASHDSVVRQLTDLNKQIADVDAQETKLHTLERDRAILEMNYKAVAKIHDERQTMEAVEAQRQSSVRVIQPPRPAVQPQPTRRLILLAGAVISFLVGMISILFTHFLRPIYLRPEALEMDTGLVVLATVPDMKRLIRAQPILIGPS